MLTILIALFVNFLTRLSQKTNLSQTHLSVLLSIIAGTVYYIATNYYSIERKELVNVVAEIYACTQIAYNLWKKYIDPVKLH